MDIFKIPKVHWRHFFGGFSFLILILQFATGIFLIFYFDPTLNNAYKSVQDLTNNILGGSLFRNLHRWIAFFIFITLLLHTIRSTLRNDFMNSNKKVAWLTGVLLLLPIFLLILTGIILPWEWKGYWFMEMVPNYSEAIPYAGPFLKTFLIDAFTLPRTFVIHILVLPVISLVLIDYHFLTTLRNRGIFKYIFRHILISIPFLIILFALATYITIPSQDPEIVPLPLDGRYIPAPEWYFLTILLPFLYYSRGNLIPVLSIYIPLILFTAFTLLPFYLKGKQREETEEGTAPVQDKVIKRRGIRNLVTGTAVFLIFAIFVALLYRGSYQSPTLGCNACHNLSSGWRMGVPPEAFKDRRILPNLDKNQWMMGHWYYPNEIW